MIKQRWKKAGLAMLLALAMAIFLIGITYAGSYNSQSFAGDTATAQKVNLTLVSNYKWRAEIYSDMYNNTIIDRLGWSSWHASHLCDGNIFSTLVLPVVSDSNIAHRGGTYDRIFYGCDSGQRRIRQNGNHEYKEGGLTIYLYTLAEGPLN